MDRALFATGGLLFSTHVAHHLVAGDESGALFVGCLLFTVGVLALPVAATGNRSQIAATTALAAGTVATAGGVGNHIVVALMTGPTDTDGSGLLTVVGGVLMVAAALRGERPAPRPREVG
jgi:hypothetical protein